MKRHKVIFIIGLFLSIALIIALCYGFSERDNFKNKTLYQGEFLSFEDSSVCEPSLEEPEEENENIPLSSDLIDNTEDIKAVEEPVQIEPESVSPQEDAAIPDETSCTLSVRCDTIFENIDRLKPEKQSIIPENGIIFAEQRVEFTEGESVFDLLLRVMRENNIHLEFVKTTIYNSAYIEGIANIYEKDCGSYSGWTYKVNGEISGVGCSSYFLKDGDCIEWVYTCNLGKDL